MRVLVSAYACEPHKGSEPGVGWNWVRQIARFHEVWVITRANNRESIEAALAKETMRNVHWIYFDLPHWTRFWKRGQRGVHLYYYLWQFGAYFVGKELHKEVGFDLVHHVTFGNYWMPSFLVLLPVPFMWGPLGGGESAPMDFYKTFGHRSKIYEWSRSMARWIGEKDPFVRLDARRAKIVLAKARETAGRLRVLCADKVQLYSESGIAEEEFRKLYAMPLRSANPFRVVSIGRLLHWKGFHLGLRAFGRFQQECSDSEYWFIGDGPERRNLQRLAHRLGVSDKVRFWGSLPREQVLEKLAECDVLVHPSLHDSGGWVCLEAMAAGRPVICLDLGGPALQVTKKTGFKVPPLSPNKVVRDIAHALKNLAGDQDLKERLGRAARRRVNEVYHWDKKGEKIAEIYEQIVKQGKPDWYEYSFDS